MYCLAGHSVWNCWGDEVIGRSLLQSGPRLLYRVVSFVAYLQWRQHPPFSGAVLGSASRSHMYLGLVKRPVIGATAKGSRICRPVPAPGGVFFFLGARIRAEGAALPIATLARLRFVSIPRTKHNNQKYKILFPSRPFLCRHWTRSCQAQRPQSQPTRPFVTKVFNRSLHHFISALVTKNRTVIG